MFVLRQLEFGLFDFRLHAEYDPAKGARIMEILNSVKEKVSVVPATPWARFPHAFSHILPVVMQQVITAIYGLMYWLLMPSLASLKRAFLIAKQVNHSLIIF